MPVYDKLMKASLNKDMQQSILAMTVSVLRFTTNTT